jgi:hypothetical protein
MVSGNGLLTLFQNLQHGGSEVRVSEGSALVCFGLVTGPGPFTGGGDVFLEGGYSPGSSPAKVGFAASLLLGPENVLTMEIGGTSAGSGYDQLEFSDGGEFVLGGTLEVKLIGGFVPQLGDMFRLFESAKMIGSFDKIVLPPLPEGLAWNDDLLESKGVLLITEDMTDSDFDGLPDYWELQHFGNLGQTGTGDTDHDGANHLSEWLAGTDPNSPLSVARLRMVDVTSGVATLALTPYLEHRTYHLRYSPDLETAWLPVPFSTQQPQADELLFFDPNASPDAKFYRVTVEVTPE